MKKCKKCGQELDADISGEYLCTECGLPTLHDNPMTEEIIFESEEQFEDILFVLNICTPKSSESKKHTEKMKELGLIRKSELQQLVDEAEDALNLAYRENMGFSCGYETVKMLFETIQALKKDHPEFKK